MQSFRGMQTESFNHPKYTIIPLKEKKMDQLINTTTLVWSVFYNHSKLQSSTCQKFRCVDKEFPYRKALLIKEVLTGQIVKSFVLTYNISAF